MDNEQKELSTRDKIAEILALIKIKKAEIRICKARLEELIKNWTEDTHKKRQLKMFKTKKEGN